jgi:hypothetical protein
MCLSSIFCDVFDCMQAKEWNNERELWLQSVTRREAALTAREQALQQTQAEFAAELKAQLKLHQTERYTHTLTLHLIRVLDCD